MSHPKRLSHIAAGGALALLSAFPVVAQACNTDPIIGSVCVYSYDWCPRGYARADGTLLPVRSYQALFTLIGNKFGGDGMNTFALPDLRSRVVVGMGTGTNLAPATFAEPIGQQSLTLSASQVPLPVHNHTAAFIPTKGPLVVPATQGQMTFTAKLPVGTTSTGATPVPPSGTNVNAYLTAMSGKVGLAPIGLTGPYTGTAPTGPTASTLPLTIKTTGTAPSAAATATVDVVSGVGITVNPATALASQPISTQAPGLGGTMCIAVVGLFPDRP